MILHFIVVLSVTYQLSLGPDENAFSVHSMIRSTFLARSFFIGRKGCPLFEETVENWIRNAGRSTKDSQGLCWHSMKEVCHRLSNMTFVKILRGNNFVISFQKSRLEIVLIFCLLGNALVSRAAIIVSDYNNHFLSGCTDL